MEWYPFSRSKASGGALGISYIACRIYSLDQGQILFWTSLKFLGLPSRMVYWCWALFPGFLCYWCLGWHPGTGSWIYHYGSPSRTPPHLLWGWSASQILPHPVVFWWIWRGLWWTEIFCSPYISFLFLWVLTAVWSLHRCSRSRLISSLMPSLSLVGPLLSCLLRVLISPLNWWISLTLLLGWCADLMLTFFSSDPKRSLARL